MADDWTTQDVLGFSTVAGALRETAQSRLQEVCDRLQREMQAMVANSTCRFSLCSGTLPSSWMVIPTTERRATTSAGRS